MSHSQFIEREKHQAEVERLQERLRDQLEENAVARLAHVQMVADQFLALKERGMTIEEYQFVVSSSAGETFPVTEYLP